MPSDHEEMTSEIPSLKAIREKRGLSLKDVAAETRISPTVIQAIEGKLYYYLPEPIYSTAFIRTYAELLGVGSAPYVEDYQGYLDSVEAERQSLQGPKAEPTSFSHYTIIGFFIAAIVVIVVLFLFHNLSVRKVQQIDRPSTSEPRPSALNGTMGEPAYSRGERQKAPSPVESQAENSFQPTSQAGNGESARAVVEGPAAAGQPGKPDGSGGYPPLASGPYLLEVEALEVTWMRIISDDREPVEVLLRPGERISQRADKNFQLAIGNAGGVRLTFQGKSLGVLGEHGQVVRLVLPPNVSSQ
ncbi:MAG: DUF4115 domain-containing protein [Deltaproteobacteria bacterium]|nr:DUF4115 domain-containing protein [Deltaproteobacteria bacterium]